MCGIVGYVGGEPALPVLLEVLPGWIRVLAERFADAVMLVPRTSELFSAAVDVVALQLFAYWLAKARGKDVDQPRNLAKTVTVE
jgi:glucosamine 6-phosphate synthetase-like amidotransferase/phosphosugar isomerase protein